MSMPDYVTYTFVKSDGTKEYEPIPLHNARLLIKYYCDLYQAVSCYAGAYTLEINQVTRV